MTRTLYFAFFVATSACVSAQEGSEKEVRGKARRHLGQIENVGCFSAHARTLDQIGSVAEVWLEVRDKSFWCERLIDYSKQVDRRDAIEKLKRIGGSGDRHIDAYDQQKMYTYQPIDMEVRIVRNPVIVPIHVIHSLYPINWTCFHHYNHVPMLKFSWLLEDGQKDVTTTWREGGKILRVTHVSDVTAENAMFKTRWIDIDPSKNFAVTRYELRGGVVGTCEGEFEWIQMNQAWIVGKGTLRTNGKIVDQWTIEDFSADAKQVRQSFRLDESKLPFGTRISESEDMNPKSKREYRFVGGDEGKAEHDMRAAAMRVSRAKK